MFLKNGGERMMLGEAGGDEHRGLEGKRGWEWVLKRVKELRGLSGEGKVEEKEQQDLGTGQTRD